MNYLTRKYSMNFQTVLNNSINDLSSTLNNDFVLQQIVARLVEKINQAKIIKKGHKYTINKYFSSYRGRISDLQAVEMKNINTSDPKNLLLLTVVYILSNMNTYDEYLVNYLFNIRQTADAVIVLLLLNNIHDIEIFCKKYNIGSEGFYNISTLKKLSELHKLQFNYY